MRVEVVCPAKVNTFLSVGPPDVGGMHPIRSIFQAVGLCDALVIEESGSGRDEMDCVAEGFVWEGLPPENTLTKALRLLRETIPVPPLRLGLVKRIPAESGLGGGSSDAAGLLRGLGAVAPGLVPEHVGRDVARAVGADVPFFLVGGRARAEGYGERLTALPDEAVRWLVVVRPSVGVGTAGAYAALDAALGVEAGRAWRDFPAGAWELYNDFERVAPCVCGDVAERLEVFGAEGAVLTGSGSAVFGVFGDEAGARAGAERAESEGLGLVWVCRTLSREESLSTTW